MSKQKFDRVYSIGCFDWFHHGHVKLLNILKSYGKQVIIGIHDDNSIEKLKKLCPSEHNDIFTRMNNVKKYADIVYVIPHTDPSHFLKCVVQDDDNKENACYIRADDYPNFPGKEFIEEKISVMFVPYTQGISSTQIRKNNKNKA